MFAGPPDTLSGQAHFLFLFWQPCCSFAEFSYRVLARPCSEFINHRYEGQVLSVVHPRAVLLINL